MCRIWQGCETERLQAPQAQRCVHLEVDRTRGQGGKRRGALGRSRRPRRPRRGARGSWCETHSFLLILYRGEHACVAHSCCPPGVVSSLLCSRVVGPGAALCVARANLPYAVLSAPHAQPM